MLVKLGGWADVRPSSSAAAGHGSLGSALSPSSLLSVVQALPPEKGFCFVLFGPVPGFSPHSTLNQCSSRKCPPKSKTTGPDGGRASQGRVQGGPLPPRPALDVCGHPWSFVPPPHTPHTLHLSRRHCYQSVCGTGNFSRRLGLTHLSSAAPYRPSTREGQVEEGVSVAAPRGDMEGSRSRVTDISESCEGQ